MAWSMYTCSERQTLFQRRLRGRACHPLIHSTLRERNPEKNPENVSGHDMVLDFPCQDSGLSRVTVIFIVWARYASFQPEVGKLPKLPSIVRGFKSAILTKHPRFIRTFITRNTDSSWYVSYINVGDGQTPQTRTAFLSMFRVLCWHPGRIS